MSQRRQLSDEERALWSSVARSVKPLRGPKKSSELSGTTVEFRPAGIRPQQPRPQLKPAAKTLPLAPLGRRLRQRVARGREPIDASIDLHGLTQREAHSALFAFLRRAQADGAALVLIVTGKGGAARERDADVERGVLRRQVPNWLSLPEFRSLVLGFEPAHAGHGGEGALYVRLRRQR
jgi:DNA-nicking Smr family endonuclease